MMDIIKWHVKQRRLFIIWWCVGIIGFVGLNLAFYPSFKDQAAQLEQSLGQIPEAAMAFFSDTGDFFSPEGYLSSQIFYLMLPMLLSIIAISLGSSLIAKEEKDGTLELLLSKPVSRSRLLLVKALSGTFIMLIIGSVSVLSIMAICSLVDIDVPATRVGVTTLLTLVFALSVGSVAYMLSTLGSFGRAASIGVTAIVALGGYIISSLVGVASWLEWPARALPFYYYRPAEVLSNTYNWGNLWYYAALISMSCLVSVIAFRKRDLG